MPNFGWLYPPGVTGNEPQITGEWPCRVCGGAGGWKDEEGGVACYWCKGTGIEPEEVEPEQIWQLATYDSVREAKEYVVRMATEWLDRHDPKTRDYLRRCFAALDDWRG